MQKFGNYFAILCVLATMLLLNFPVSASPAPVGYDIIPVSCYDRMPDDSDLLTIITPTYAISADYEPSDLVLLPEYVGYAVTLSNDIYVREALAVPLQTMIAEMQSLGMRPSVVSAYRSFDHQNFVWQHWYREYGERAREISAIPGTSEHQLGTTVDFGSPEHSHKFFTTFYLTREGSWLIENAHDYGFVLSYPDEESPLIQYEYEPWHYRFVGVELATYLRSSNQTLLQYQHDTLSIPCTPARVVPKNVR